MKNVIIIPVTKANLISALLDASVRHFQSAGKLISAYEAEKCAQYIRERKIISDVKTSDKP